MGDIRAFVAILLDDRIRGELGAAIESLRPAARDIAWVAPANLHLTLKFLGEVAEVRIDAIVGALRTAASSLSAFDAELGGLGAFPSPARPRVVWAGVTAGAGAMGDLAGCVDDALAPLGVAREARPFFAHVTLGRARYPSRNPALTEALRAAAGRAFGPIRVARASLMRSELAPRGARYMELAAVSLGGALGSGV